MTQQFVLDSSVILKFLNQTNEQHLEKADKIIADFLAKKCSLIAPELAKYEVGNALLKGKKLSALEMLSSGASLYLLPIEWIPFNQDLFMEAAKIAVTNKITFYDASFLALAKINHATLITANPKHQKTKGVKVTNLSNYKSD